MRALLFAVALTLASSSPAEARGSRKSSSSSSKKSAPVCKKGKACGNSCIAKSAVCHQEKGTATNANEQPEDQQKDQQKPRR